MSARDAERWQRHVDALHRFRAGEGLYFSYVHHDRTGYSWMDERGRPIIGFDRVVNANVLRYLGLVGVDAPAVRAHLIAESAAADFAVGSHDYPNPLTFLFMLARAWRQARQPDRPDLSRLLVPRVLALQREDGSFGGPLSTAMAMSALLDFDAGGPALARARAALLAQADPWGGWRYEDFVVHGFGSPGWTSAAAAMVLARCLAREV